MLFAPNDLGRDDRAGQRVSASSPDQGLLLQTLERYRTAIDRRLEKLAGTNSIAPPLRGPVEAVLLSSGKRVRGMLLLASAEALGADIEQMLDAAAAFEMIHASSLVLDDLPSMDDAAMRRGEPTLHRQFSEDLAILTAVALLNHSYGLIGACHASLRPRRWSSYDVMQQVVDAVGWDGTIGGESVDLHSDGQMLDFETLEYIHSRKTGRLFVASAVCGAMLSNAGTSAIRNLEAYAKNLGLAFQITDDVLDSMSTPEQLGKDVGKDEGKLTFVRLAGVEGARQLASELVESSLAAIEPLGRDGKVLEALARMVRDRTK